MDTTEENLISGLNLERIYAYRFRNIPQNERMVVWRQIAKFLQKKLGNPQRVLDPAAGKGEFINQIDAPERWAVDLVEQVDFESQGVKFLRGNINDVELPRSKFDAIFVSNFLEHLESIEALSTFLRRMYDSLDTGGKIMIMGPNFKYVAHAYYDFADHILPLTERSVEEHLVSAGFKVEEVVPKFLPYSFSGNLPRASWLIRLYLSMPWAWKIMGKQFLVVASKA